MADFEKDVMEALKELQDTVYGPRSDVKSGLSHRVNIIESYIENYEERMREDRRQRRQAIYGVYAGVILLIIQLAAKFLGY